MAACTMAASAAKVDDAANSIDVDAEIDVNLNSDASGVLLSGNLIKRFSDRVSCVVEGEQGSLDLVPGLKELDDIEDIVRHRFDSDDDPALMALHACSMIERCPKLVSALVECDEHAVYFCGHGSMGTMFFKTTGDVLNTHRSHAHLTHESGKVSYSPARVHEVQDNLRTLGNTCLTYKPDKPLASVNCSRNGRFGAYPHDDLALYLMHVGAFCYGERYESGQDFKVHAPLKVVLQEDSTEFFGLFDDLEGFVNAYALDAMYGCDGTLANTYEMPWAEYVEFVEEFSAKRGQLLLDDFRKTD